MTLLRTLKRDKVKIGIAGVAVFIFLHFLYISLFRRDTYSVVVAEQKLNPPPHPVVAPKAAVSSVHPQVVVTASAVAKPKAKPKAPQVVSAVPQSPKKPAEEAGSSKPVVDTAKQAVVKSIHDYTVFFNDLEKYALKSPSLRAKYKKEKAKEVFNTDGNFLISKEYLEGILDIPDSTAKELKESHTKYVHEHISKLVDTYGVSTFGNLVKSDPEWSKYEGSRGYVIVGGGKYSWLSYLVIRQIRLTGSNLPIELFISSKDDYELEFCEIVLPKYNARCNVFDDGLAKDLKKRFHIGGYQFKMLAIISSKFENVLYIDSDNFPARNIDYLFDSKLYKEKNLVLWPDAWSRTTNPKYYDIAGVKVTERKTQYSKYDLIRAELEGRDKPKPFEEYNFGNSNYHDFEGTLPNPSSETGMIMVNKTSHLKTLLLCLYYNVFGPHFYYPLLTQGSAGEGDKETFIAAAHVMKEPWFQTKTQFKWVGYYSKVDNKYSAKALGHFDPEQSQSGPAEGKKETDLVFMHLSFPKFYPDWLVNNYDLVYKDSGEHIRMYQGAYENVGYDFDLRVLQLFVQGMCPNYYDDKGNAVDGSDVNRSEYMGRYLQYVRAEDAIQRKRCEEVFIPHLAWLKSTTKTPKEQSHNK